MNVIETHSSEETYKFAAEMGAKASGGDVLALAGDLGAGKTVFAKGFAAGLGVKEPVSSPTYTIVQQYDDGRLPLYHFDVYRIGDESEMDETGFDDCIFGNGVTLVEWAGLIKDIMPEHTVWVTIEKDAAKGDDYRRISIGNNESRPDGGATS